MIEPEDNNNQLITDSEDEKVRKRLECATKRKVRRDNICASIWQTDLTTDFAAFLSSYSPIIALLSYLSIVALLFYSPSSMATLLSYSPLSTLLSCFSIPVLLSYPPMPVLLSYLLILALLSPPILTSLTLFIPALLSHSVLGLDLTYLIFLALRIFKEALLDEFLHHSLTSLSLTKPFSPFLTLGLLSYYKRSFKTMFLNSRPSARNHATKEVNLSFQECGSFASVKFNQLQQLKLLDRKPVYIIEVIALAVILFQDLLFIFFPYYTMTLAIKPGLQT